MRYTPFRKRRFMREHRWSSKRLSDYLDSDLERGERERLETHTSVCPQCHRLLATLRRTLESLRDLGGTPAPDVTARVLQRFREQG